MNKQEQIEQAQKTGDIETMHLLENDIPMAVCSHSCPPCEGCKQIFKPENCVSGGELNYQFKNNKMNRIIKFRAWDYDREEMDYFDLRSYDDALHDNFGTLEQFTGLTDKNGTSIYEGDIVQEKSKPNWHSVVNNLSVIEFGEQDLGNSAEKQTIGWNATPISQFGKPSGMDSGRLSEGILGLCLNHTGIDCEVIGNIHENPELLPVTSSKTTK